MDSVGRAAKANMLLIVECGHCYHVGRFRANDVAKVVGWNKPLEIIHFKCKRCSRKDATVRTQFIDQDRPLKGYIECYRHSSARILCLEPEPSRGHSVLGCGAADAVRAMHAAGVRCGHTVPQREAGHQKYVGGGFGRPYGAAGDLER